MAIGQRRNLLAVAFMALLLSGMTPMTAQDQEKPYPEINQQFQPLKDQFNADVGKVRLLLILDPT